MSITAETVWKWRTEHIERCGKSRKEQDRDAEMYDPGFQWDAEDRRVLEERGQPAMEYNRVKPVVDLVTGTHAKAKMELVALPRGGDDDVATADVMTKCIKFEEDTQFAQFIQSDVFESGIKAGIGWVVIENNPRMDESDILIRQIHRRRMRYDPSCTDWLMRKQFCRWHIYEDWLDVDVAKALYPQFASKIGAAVDQKVDDLEENIDQPYEHTGSGSDMHGSVRDWQRSTRPTDWMSTDRKRVLLLQVEYSVPRQAMVLKFKDGTLEEFKEEDQRQTMSVMAGLAKPKICTVYDVYNALVCGNEVLWDKATPDRHGEYKYLPFCVFRDDKDGHPYGLIRQMRDPQRSLNKRRSKALHILNTVRVLAEQGALGEGVDIKEEIGRPDVFLTDLAPGSLSESRFRIERDEALAQDLMKISLDDERQIAEVAGIQQEGLGAESNAKSGRAIALRQVQGQTTLGRPFENWTRFRNWYGYILASKIQETWTDYKVVRVTDNVGAPTFLEVNKPVTDPETGMLVGIQNDITRLRFDIVISEQQYHESIRQALMDQMMELVGRLPPEIMVQMLDLVFEYSDFPGKGKIVERLRQVMQMQQQQAQEAQQAEMMQQAQKNQLDAQKVELQQGSQQVAVQKMVMDAERDVQKTKEKAA